MRLGGVGHLLRKVIDNADVTRPAFKAAEISIEFERRSVEKSGSFKFSAVEYGLQASIQLR